MTFPSDVPALSRALRMLDETEFMKLRSMANQHLLLEIQMEQRHMEAGYFYFVFDDETEGLLRELLNARHAERLSAVSD